MWYLENTEDTWYTENTKYTWYTDDTMHIENTVKMHTVVHMVHKAARLEERPRGWKSGPEECTLN